jgi:hypothetical protein
VPHPTIPEYTVVSFQKRMADPFENCSTQTKRKSAADTGQLSSKAARRAVARPAATQACYDSDLEPPPEDQQSRLKWRGDPAETHSDWTIEIVSKQQGKADETQEEEETVVDTYHVHKFVLAYGARRSEYFVNLFSSRGKCFAESKSSTSRIELEPLAAKAFPKVLDYIYATHREKLDIDTETATALHFLGSYFGLRALRWETKQFWKGDITCKTAATYYSHARIFHDDKIKERVTSFVRGPHFGIRQNL